MAVIVEQDTAAGIGIGARVWRCDLCRCFHLRAGEVLLTLTREFALLTGMRPEEYLALQWADVDLTSGAAQIKRALVRHKKCWSFEDTKTARSRRTVFLPAPLLGKLTVHKRKQTAARLLAGASWHATI